MLSVAASCSQRIALRSRMSWDGGLWCYQPSCTLLFQVTTEAHVLRWFSDLKEFSFCKEQSLYKLLACIVYVVGLP